MKRHSLVALLAAACAAGAACGGTGGGKVADGSRDGDAKDAPADSNLADGDANLADGDANLADGDGATSHETGSDASLDAHAWETLPAGVLAFDVTATLVVTPPAGDEGAWLAFPRAHAFTLVWRPADGQVLVGAAGRGSASAITSPDGRLFHAAAPLTTNVPYAQGCGPSTIGYGELVFSTDGDVLAGTAHGTATFQTGDTQWTAPVTAVLTGTRDVTAPVLAIPTALSDPLAPVTIDVSEPLPASAAASLVGASSGQTVALVPVLIDGGGGVMAFSKPNVALGPGESYDLVTDGLADFAGNRPSGPITLPQVAAPPLVAQDGFESVAGTMFAGAGVLRGGPLMPIAGATSLLLNTGFGGGFGFLPYDLGPSLAVRLAVAPGDTVVRFDSQLIAPDPIDTASFVGAILLGAVGQPVGMSMNVDGQDFAKVTLPQLGDVYLSPVKTVELPLPPGATDEIMFEIEGVTFACSPPPPPTVLVLDNLRVE